MGMIMIVVVSMAVTLVSVTFMIVVVMDVTPILFASDRDDQLGFGPFVVEIFAQVRVGRDKPRRLACGVAGVRAGG